jgi:D-glucuronyl C5-epimerase C-terminus
MKRGIVAGLVLALGAVAPAAAEASSVLKVKDGKARRAHDPLLPPRSKTALPVVPRRAVLSTRAQRAPLARAAALTPVERATYTSALTDAKRARDGLTGAPRSELSAVIATSEALDRRGELSASRLNAIVMTLRRNTEFWKLNQPPAAGTRVEFAGSPVILEYYAGRGLQIQPLANFGKANAAWSTCKGKADRTCTKLRAHLDAMIALAARRGTFTTWEYYFDFEGGVPPWTSGMSQGTGIQALSRAYNLTGVTRYRDVATAALAAFETAPPVGVAQPATSGTHYLMYSYAPSLFIFNGFLQSLVGLDDYRDYTGDARGTTLFRAGHSHARWLVPQADTGSWSRYSLGGPVSTREYHVLLRDILANLCKRIGTPEYCTTADRFTQYLAAPAAPR